MWLRLHMASGAHGCQLCPADTCSAVAPARRSPPGLGPLHLCGLRAQNGGERETRVPREMRWGKGTHRSANPAVRRSAWLFHSVLCHSRSPCLRSSVPLGRTAGGHRGDCGTCTGRRTSKGTAPALELCTAAVCGAAVQRPHVPLPFIP